MNSKVKATVLWIVLAGLLALRMSLGFAVAETAGPSEIVAERVPFSQLVPGDRFVIVSECADAALSLNPLWRKVGVANATLAHTESRQVLTAISPEAAVFEFEPPKDGDIYLKCQNGYLTIPETGKELYYSPTPVLNSVWRVLDDGSICNPNAVIDNQDYPDSKLCLEYYPQGPCFDIYLKELESNTSQFVMEFYRLGNSVPGEAVVEDTQYLLPVFETSDTHGYLADVSGDDPQYLLAYISDKVKDVRGYGPQARKDLAVLLDGGDVYQGNTLSSRFNGGSLSAAYALMGYDAVALGNHEFDWLLEHMVDPDGTMPDYSFEGYSGANTIPVLVCNLYQNEKKLNIVSDYVILEKTARDRFGHELPVKIGVIGMAGDYGSSIIRSLFYDLGYEIKMDYDFVNALARELEDSGQCDATILLAHEKSTSITRELGEDSAIDLVLGGHAHRTVKGKTVQGLTFMEPSYHGKAFACAELAFDGSAAEPKFLGVENAHIHLTTQPDAQKLLNKPDNAEELDAELVQLTDDVIEKVSDFLASEVGYITEPILKSEYLTDRKKRASVCGSWVCSIFARAVDAEVGFMNSAGIRTELAILPGKSSRAVTLSDLYDMFPNENRICCFELTWEELLTALEYSITRSGGILLTDMFGVECYYTDAGINAIVARDGEAVYVNGAWKEGWKDKKVRVALNEYIATTNRNREGERPNPFVEWYDTPRLISKDETDIECAIRVLVQEAARNDGHLSVDTTPCYINEIYSADS